MTPDALRSAPPARLAHVADAGLTGLHWYDLTCPFCYLGQVRTQLLKQRGLTVIELPFQAHPDIPTEGIHVGPRRGPMYLSIERTASSSGLALKWPPRLPNSRIALAAAEWVRRQRPESFSAVQARLFRAHFADGLDIGAIETVLACVAEVMGQVDRLRDALAGTELFDWIEQAESLGRRFGVAGTPSWRIAGRMINGFLPSDEFERVAGLAHSYSMPLGRPVGAPRTVERQP